MSRTELTRRLRARTAQLPEAPAPVVAGQVVRMVGLALEAEGIRLPVGQHCVVELDRGRSVEAEVIGFAGGRLLLMPITRIEGMRAGARVLPIPHERDVPMGEALLGRVIDARGQPLDSDGPLGDVERGEVGSTPINPLHRAPIREPLDVGVRAINALLTTGRGQRIGLMAGSGVGKSVLLGMMARFTTADVTVVALVGERGREVKEFIDDILGPEGLARSVVVASPADESPLLRLRAANMATRIAEYFRDQGKNVLLLMDSLTRFAQAQREIALAAGEPPATRGYPPSVFAMIPQLVERAGNGRQGGGSITAFYTVLVEGDDLQDPVGDAARAILDGHLVLSRRLADAGHYPAIDVEASISRAMPAVVSDSHLQWAMRFRQIWSRYEQSRDLIQVGAYQPGSDAETDLAIERLPHMRQFLRQGMNEQFGYRESVDRLQGVVNPTRETMPAAMPRREGPS